MSKNMVERVTNAIQNKCRERGFNECPAPLVNHVAITAIAAVREYLRECGCDTGSAIHEINKALAARPVETIEGA